MTSQTLRELAREYAKGTLDRESYRRSRAELIDGILSGTLQVAPIDYAAPVANKPSLDTTHPGKRRKKEASGSEVDELDFFDITQVVPPASDTTQVISQSSDITPPRPAPPSRQGEAGPLPARLLENRPLLAAVIVGALLLLVLGTVLLARPGHRQATTVSQDPDSTDATSAAGANVAPPQSQDPAATGSAGTLAKDAIAEFLRAKIWSDESMAQFHASWDALPQAERDAAAGSTEMLQMANAIYRKLLELRALSQVNEDAASAERQARLLEFARDLGITDPRLVPVSAGTVPGSG